MMSVLQIHVCSKELTYHNQMTSSFKGSYNWIPQICPLWGMYINVGQDIQNVPHGYYTFDESFPPEVRHVTKANIATQQSVGCKR